MLLNRFSFLMFQAVTPPEPCDLLPLPTGGDFAPSAASVIIVPGEQYKIYIPFDAVSLSPLTVHLVQSDIPGAVSIPVGTIETVPDTDHALLTFTVPNTVTVEGYYRLKLFRLGDVLYSNRVWLNYSDYEERSALFSFRNIRPIGPIQYDVAETFRNILRLKCVASEPQKESNVQTYEAVTTGKKRTVEAKAHSFIKFYTPLTDAFGHEGWSTLLSHKDLLINGQPFTLKTGYSIDEESRLPTGTFEVWDDDYSSINRC